MDMLINTTLNNTTLDLCNLAIRTALDSDEVAAPTDAMTPISATEKWHENLGRIQDANAAEAAGQAAMEKRRRAAQKTRAANGKAVRKVCSKLSGSEDMRVIRQYVAMRNACDRANGKHQYEPVVVPLDDSKNLTPGSIYQNSLQMVVTEGGIRILHRGFSWDTAKRPTWFQRRATECFDPAEIEAGAKAAADAIRRGDDPAGTSYARIG